MLHVRKEGVPDQPEFDASKPQIFPNVGLRLAEVDLEPASLCIGQTANGTLAEP
jgi:hypothetical protein